jgi:hypothetical protein
MLDKLTSADFSPHLNQKFRLSGNLLELLEVELIEVSNLSTKQSTSPHDVKRQPFSIVLVGPGEPVLPQGIYKVEHDNLGPLDLFLVPIGPNQKGMCYEAVFA